MAKCGVVKRGGESFGKVVYHKKLSSSNYETGQCVIDDAPIIQNGYIVLKSNPDGDIGDSGGAFFVEDGVAIYILRSSSDVINTCTIDSVSGTYTLNKGYTGAGYHVAVIVEFKEMID